MLLLFLMDVVKVDRGILHMLRILQVFVSSVLEAYCKHLFKIFHLFTDVCFNRIYLDVAYVFTHMLQQYVPNVSAVFSLMLQ